MSEDKTEISAKPVVVRGAITWGTHIGIFFIRFVLILIIASTFEHQRWKNGMEELAFPIGCAVFWLIMDFFYVAAILSRTWVVDLGDGFEYRTRFSRRRYRDDQIESLSVIPAEAYWSSFGASHFSHESFAVRLEDGKLRRWDVFYKEEKQSSPILPLMNRLYATYKSRVEQKFGNREFLEGKNWKFDGETFQYVDRFGSWQSAAPERIAAVEIVIRDIVVWSHESNDATELDEWQAEPLIRIPVNSENASFLYEFLRPLVTVKPFEPNRPGVLGRFLYDLKPGRYPSLAATLFFGVMGGAMIYDGSWFILIFGVLFSLGSLFFLCVFLSTPLRIRIFDRGLKRIWLSSARSLYYEDVLTFTYSMVTHYVNEVYFFTAIELNIQTDPELPGPKTEPKGVVLRSYSFYSLTKEYALILDRMAAAVARRMRRQLDENGSVEWMPGVIFHSDRLEYRVEQMNKGPIAHEIPYEQVVCFIPLPEYPDYVCCVYKPNPDEDEMMQAPLPKNAPNYMPGYHLITEIVAETTSPKR